MIILLCIHMNIIINAEGHKTGYIKIFLAKQVVAYVLFYLTVV